MKTVSRNNKESTTLNKLTEKERKSTAIEGYISATDTKIETGKGLETWENSNH